MEPLTLTEVRMLARAVVAAGDSFCCRRLLQRFEREELEFRDVLVRLAALQPRQTLHGPTMLKPDATSLAKGPSIPRVPAKQSAAKDGSTPKI